MADQILIEDLEFTGHHGWFDHERVHGCRFRIDLSMNVDQRPAALSDRLDDTVDYSAVAETILAVGTGASHRLLERLAECIITAIFEEHPLIDHVQLTLRKLHPPMAGAPTAVAMRIERHRESVEK